MYVVTEVQKLQSRLEGGCNVTLNPVNVTESTLLKSLVCISKENFNELERVSHNVGTAK